MINLYCYHSSAASSVGFQETVWTVKDGDCRLVSMELRLSGRKEPKPSAWIRGEGPAPLCCGGSLSVQAISPAGV